MLAGRLAAPLVAVLVATALLVTARAAGPDVVITAPAAGVTVDGTIRLTAEAPDAERVEFYLNGVRVASDESGPGFSEEFDTRQVLAGEFDLVARAVNDAGATLSDPVMFSIGDPEPEPEPQPTPPGDAPPSPPVTAVGFPECEGPDAHVVHPAGPAQYRPDSSVFGQKTVMDARGAAWTRETAGDYPVVFKDGDYPAGGTVCWLGGGITSSEDMAASRDDVWHHTYAFYTDHPYTTIVGLRADNQGDCIGIKEPGDASLTRIHGVALTDCHDDAVENDLMKNVEVVDSVLEGYVLFAFRGGSAGAADGRNNKFRIDGVIGWAKPQQAVYKGKAPGTGPIFKRPQKESEEGWEPNFTITDSTFRVDMKPNHDDLSIPPGPHSGNVIVWTGDGAYPGKVPAGFRVTTTNLRVWSDARAAWMAAH